MACGTLAPQAHTKKHRLCNVTRAGRGRQCNQGGTCSSLNFKLLCKGLFTPAAVNWENFQAVRLTRCLHVCDPASIAQDWLAKHAWTLASGQGCTVSTACFHSQYSNAPHQCFYAHALIHTATAVPCTTHRALHATRCSCLESGVARPAWEGDDLPDVIQPSGKEDETLKAQAKTCTKDTQTTCGSTL